MVIGLEEPQKDKAHQDPSPADDGDLPAASAGLAGTSAAHKEHYQLTVSNAAGYLCHIHLEARYSCSPDLVFRILSNPDNTHVFRDIKRIASRKVLELDPSGRKVIEIEQVGESRILWHKQEFATLLNVIEDTRDAEHMTTSFELIQSDILGKFNGRWTLTPLHEDGEVVGCCAVLDQDLLPKGIPSFLKHVPVLGDVLRNISVRAVKRLVEDLDRVVEQLQAGRSWDEVFGGGERMRGHALELSDVSEEETEAEAEAGAHQRERAGGAHAAASGAAAAPGARASVPEAAGGGHSRNDRPAEAGAGEGAADRVGVASGPAHAAPGAGGPSANGGEA